MIKDITQVGKEVSDEELRLAVGGARRETGYITYFNNACYNDVKTDSGGGDPPVILV